ncbi:MAG: glycosyltransferase family 39 protein [Candidatus Contendobacter sp.]|nr:glycosyltransferase family 39 protein [Candidatus Contendobacter sp.]
MSTRAATLLCRATQQSGRADWRRLLLMWGVVAAYFALNALTQFLTSGTADQDQAEQLLLSQTLEWGYGAQPPLYTYLVRLAFSMFGLGLGPLLGLKVLLLSMTVGAMMTLGHRLGFSWHQQLIGVAGYVFIPQLIWESQRDLTHSVLATSLAAATLLQVARLADERSGSGYVALGLLIGLGLISKYNYAIFLAALLLAAGMVPAYRAWLLERRFAITVLVALLVVAPHFSWLLANLELATSSAHKFKAGAGDALSGLVTAGMAALAFLTPLWLFSLLPLSATSRSALLAVARSGHGRFLLSLLAAVTLLVIVFVGLSEAQQVKDRWYQPLLFYLPWVIALFCGPTAGRRGRLYLAIAGFFALLVAVLLPARTLLAEKLDHYSRPNLPYPALFERLARSIDPPGYVLTETNLLAGNARPFFPHADFRVTMYSIPVRAIAGTGILICATPGCENKKFRDWLLQACGLDPRTLAFAKLEAPYLYAPSNTLTIFWAHANLASPCMMAAGMGGN